MDINRSAYERDGYLIVRLLDDDDLAVAQRGAQAAMTIEQRDGPVSTTRWSNLFRDEPGYEPMQLLCVHASIMRLAATLLGEPIVLEGAVMLAADEGNTYKQGWHRDVLQVPQALIDESRFSPNCFHNCLQINLALADDQSLWIVPASHNRPNTPAENAAFGGSKHRSPEEADMPGGMCVELKAGEAAVYNNNLIHRGHNATGHRRLTFHASYHCTRYPPTWHFYGKTFGELDESQATRLPAALREQWSLNRQVRQRYPDIATSYARR